MSGATKIEWASRVWNPIIGCSPLHEGCDHCYAARMATRLAGNPKTPQYKRIAKGGKWTGRLRFCEDELLRPLHWRKPGRVFMSMCDPFHRRVQDKWLDKIHAVIALTPHLEYVLLTKRPKNALRYYQRLKSGKSLLCDAAAFHLGGDPRRMLGVLVGTVLAKCGNVLPNLTIGVSCSLQDHVDCMVPTLLQIPAARRIVSLEPLLGPVNLREVEAWLTSETGALEEGESPRLDIDGIIVGGETGPGARPIHPEWVRSLRDQCKAAGVPFFFKSWGEWGSDTDEALMDSLAEEELGQPVRHHWPDGQASYRVGRRISGCLLDGQTHHEWAEVRR